MKNNVMNNEEDFALRVMERTLWLKKPYSERVSAAKNIAKRAALHPSNRSDPLTAKRILFNLLNAIYSPEDYNQFLKFSS